MLHPDEDLTDISGYIKFYCAFGYFLLLVWGFHMIISNNMKVLESVNAKLVEHIELVLPASLIGILFIISEFLASMVYLKDFYIFTSFRMFVWLPTLFVFTFILYKIGRVCCKKHKEKSDYVKAIIAAFTLILLLFLIHIYCYALPTFLLLLVYPTKVITVVAYLITFVFVASMIFSVSMRLVIVSAINCRTLGRLRSFLLILNGIVVFVHPIIMFVVVIYFLYALVLGEASAISAGPYTVLSLIPTAAISAATWLVKNKVYTSVSEKEDEKDKENSKEDESEDDAKSTTTNEESLTLIVNGDTPRPVSVNGIDRDITAVEINSAETAM